jgi:hypothetical protein
MYPFLKAPESMEYPIYRQPRTIYKQVPGHQDLTKYSDTTKDSMLE